MPWALSRETSRSEDIAYCLLRIFDVSMPLAYGEGWKAFLRLQEEIMETQADYTLFAWKIENSARFVSYCAQAGLQPPILYLFRSGLLATHPSAFAKSKDLVTQDVPIPPSRNAFPLGNRGLYMWVNVTECDIVSFQVATLPVECGRHDLKTKELRRDAYEALGIYVTSFRGACLERVVLLLMNKKLTSRLWMGLENNPTEVLFARNILQPNLGKNSYIVDLYRSTLVESEKDEFYHILGTSIHDEGKVFSRPWFTFPNPPPRHPLRANFQIPTGVLFLLHGKELYFLFFGVDTVGKYKPILFLYRSDFDGGW